MRISPPLPDNVEDHRQLGGVGRCSFGLGVVCLIISSIVSKLITRMQQQLMVNHSPCYVGCQRKPEATEANFPLR